MKNNRARLLYNIAEWGSGHWIAQSISSWTGQLIKTVHIAIFHDEVTENKNTKIVKN